MRLSNGEVLLAWPLAQHIITQGWFYNDGSLHQAVDLRTQIDNMYIRPVYAAEDGTVDQTQDWDGHTRTGMQSYGNMVRIKHAPYKGSVLQTRYAHLSSYCVKYGQQVKEGEIIGYSGVTGNVFGAHMHFEVILGGKRTNPLVWLDNDFTTASGQVFTYRPGEHAVEKPADAAQPSGEEVLIDVSHHQGAIDWAKVPYRALVRIGYRGYGSGKLMKDEQYDANLAGAKANNKLLGFYFFSQAITVDEAREEADFCASLAPTGYPLFFDSEWGHTTKTGVHDGRADNLTKAQRTACARAFCVRAAALGYQPGVYTFTLFATANIDYEGLCKDYIGWLADTRANYDTSLPRYIHQYSQAAKGGVPGIWPETDLNRIVKALPAVDKPERKLQVITIGPVSQGDADAIYLLCKERGLTDAGLYKSEWAEV
jgi:GH25 family lysozyme M1 (1,4-beta-N-acetylmuramidase)